MGEAVFHHSGDAVNMNSTAFTASRRKAFDCFAWACSMTLPTAATPAEPEQAAPKRGCEETSQGRNLWHGTAWNGAERHQRGKLGKSVFGCGGWRRLSSLQVARHPPEAVNHFRGCTHYTSPRGVMSFAAYCRPEGVRDIPVYQARRRSGMLLGHCPRTSPQAR